MKGKKLLVGLLIGMSVIAAGSIAYNVPVAKEWIDTKIVTPVVDFFTPVAADPSSSEEVSSEVSSEASAMHYIDVSNAVFNL